MVTMKVHAMIDAQRRLSAELPTLPPTVKQGGVDVILMFPDAADEAEGAWEAGIAREWADDLGDARQDLYSLADGTPVDAPR